MDLALFFILILKSSVLSTGGLGPLPFLHNDFISRGWATEREFTEALAVGQSSPGPNGLWVVSFGYLTAGLPGAVLALLALLIPPFAVLVVQLIYDRLANHIAMKGFMDGMVLAIAATGFVIFAQPLLLYPKTLRVPGIPRSRIGHPRSEKGEGGHPIWSLSCGQ